MRLLWHIWLLLMPFLITAESIALTSLEKDNIEVVAWDLGLCISPEQIEALEANHPQESKLQELYHAPNAASFRKILHTLLPPNFLGPDEPIFLKTFMLQKRIQEKGDALSSTEQEFWKLILKSEKEPLNKKPLRQFCATSYGKMTPKEWDEMILAGIEYFIYADMHSLADTLVPEVQNPKSFQYFIIDDLFYGLLGDAVAKSFGKKEPHRPLPPDGTHNVEFFAEILAGV